MKVFGDPSAQCLGTVCAMLGGSTNMCPTRFCSASARRCGTTTVERMRSERALERQLSSGCAPEALWNDSCRADELQRRVGPTAVERMRSGRDLGRQLSSGCAPDAHWNDNYVLGSTPTAVTEIGVRKPLGRDFKKSGPFDTNLHQRIVIKFRRVQNPFFGLLGSFR